MLGKVFVLAERTRALSDEAESERVRAWRESVARMRAYPWPVVFIPKSDRTDGG